MTRRFKDKPLQELYDKYSANPPIRQSRVLVSDYWRGFDHPDSPQSLSPRGSASYAAWAAGVDAARRAAKRLASERLVKNA